MPRPPRRAGAGRRRHRPGAEPDRSLPTSGSIRKPIWRLALPSRGHGSRLVGRAARAGLRVYQTTALFFDPELLQSFPDARPVDANGDPDIGFDWYLGICPTHDGYLAAKIDRLQRVAAELEPDGLFLSFTRYPGFWENWVPGYTFTNADRFCFCPRCRAGLPRIWTRPRSWRCRDPGARHPRRARRCMDCLARAADRRGRRIAAAVRAARPGLEIMLNTLAFPPPTSTGSMCGGRSRRRISGCCAGRLTGSS